MNQPAKAPPAEIKPEDRALTMLNDRNMIAQIGAALPKHFAADRMIRIAMTELRKTPKLRLCDPYSFIGAVMQCAQLGLEPGSGLGHAYLIPYGKECTMLTGYKGHVELMRRSGQVGPIQAELVRRGDKFIYGVDRDGPYLNWTPGSMEGGFLSRVFNKRDQAKEVYAVFAQAGFRAGGSQHVVLTIEEVDTIRDVVLSKAYKPELSPWNNFYGEMTKKTAIRRLAKMMPQSPEYVRIAELDDAADAGAQFRMTLRPLIEAGVIDENYDPEPEKSTRDAYAPPNDQAKMDARRKQAIEEFTALHDKAKAKGLNVGKLLGGEASAIILAPVDQIETCADVLRGEL